MPFSRRRAIVPTALVALGLATCAAAVATGPGPTVASCLASWNAAPPPDLPASAPAYVAALNGGITIAHTGGARTAIPGNACTVTVVQAPDRTRLYAASWHGGTATRWLAPLRTGGLLAGESANATLGADGRLVARPQPGVTALRVSPPSATPGISRTLGATGWAGGVRLFDTFDRARARFGRPSSERRVAFGCEATWGRLGVIADFGFARGSTTGCAGSARAVGFTAGSTWATTTGLRVGMPASAIEHWYPGAGHVAGTDGQTTWYLVPRTGSGQHPLTATASPLGTIVSLSLGATVESGTDATVSSGTFVWGAP